MRLRDEVVEIGAVAKAFVDLKMIDRVVTMGGRGKDRPEQHARGTEIDGIVKPRGEMAEAMRDTGAGRGLAFRSNEAKRIDVPPYGSFDPAPHRCLPG